MTRYTYDPLNFRLLRIRSEKFVLTSVNHQLIPDGGVQQDLAYQYDLGGNIIGIRDKAPASGSVQGPGDLLKVFSYDPLKRLLTATGRESTAPSALPTWDAGLRAHDHTATNTYTRAYSYDKVGNVLQEQHTADGHGANSFTKEFNYHATGDHNRLLSYEVGATTFALEYDANGNLLKETTSRYHQWDHSDQLKYFMVRAGSSGPPSVWAHYFYDAAGTRLKKVVSKLVGGNLIQEVTVYIDGVFEETYVTNNGTVDPDRHYNTLHVMDGRSRIATIRVGTDVEDPTPTVKFNLEDHLGTSSVTLDFGRNLINREEYYPFGDTCFGAFAKKRYRYVGKEKDNESGLYYYGARYYAPWTCRFVNVDPLAAQYAHLTPYNYAGNKPIGDLDIDGMQGTGESTAPSGGGSAQFDKVASAFWEFHNAGSPQIDVTEINGVTFGKLTSDKETIFYDSRIGYARHDGRMSGAVEEVNGGHEWIANRSYDHPENGPTLNYSSPFFESPGDILLSGEQLGWERGYRIAAGTVQAMSFGSANDMMPDSTITTDHLFYQFVTGTGSDVHVFDENSWMGWNMSRVTEVQNALEEKAGQYVSGDTSAFRFGRSIGTEPRIDYATTFVRDVATDPVRAIHGSFNGTVTPLGTFVRDGQSFAMMRVVIGDVLGAESATHRPPKDGSYGASVLPNDPHGENSPFSSTSVFYDMRIAVRLCGR